MLYKDNKEFLGSHARVRDYKGKIAAIADQTVITWGLGKKIGDELVYIDEKGKELRLKLIAGLDDSIFQGKVIISEDNFIRHFPSSGGKNLFLIHSADGISENDEKILRQGFSDLGWILV